MISVLPIVLAVMGIMALTSYYIFIDNQIVDSKAADDGGMTLTKVKKLKRLRLAIVFAIALLVLSIPVSVLLAQNDVTYKDVKSLYKGSFLRPR